jgi:serine protease Do
MFKGSIFLGMLLLLATGLNADEVKLKQNGTVTGKILAEKFDRIFVDIGYTVIEIPRAEIDRIIKKGRKAGNPETKPAKPAGQMVKKGLYLTNSRQPPALTVRELVKRLGESVVQVKTPGGLGSGYFIDQEGYLITNFHVVEGESRITIEVYHQDDGQLNRRSYREVRIVALNKFADLALLKIEDKKAGPFKPVPLGYADRLGVGEKVFAIGSPLGLERTVTEGIISTKTRQMQGALYLQTTAQINPGNSGGPLFNLSGEVIGVINMKMAFGEGLGFAIPVEQVKYFVDHREAFAYDNDNPSNGYIYLPPPSRTSEGSSVTRKIPLKSKRSKASR